MIFCGHLSVFLRIGTFRDRSPFSGRCRFGSTFVRDKSYDPNLPFHILYLLSDPYIVFRFGIFVWRSHHVSFLFGSDHSGVGSSLSERIIFWVDQFYVVFCIFRDWFPLTVGFRSCGSTFVRDESHVPSSLFHVLHFQRRQLPVYPRPLKIHFVLESYHRMSLPFGSGRSGVVSSLSGRIIFWGDDL